VRKIAVCVVVAVVGALVSACPNGSKIPTNDAPGNVGGVVDEVRKTDNGYPELIIRLNDGRVISEVYVAEPVPQACVLGAAWPDCTKK
jgi:hypothetical protein